MLRPNGVTMATERPKISSAALRRDRPRKMDRKRAPLPGWLPKESKRERGHAEAPSVPAHIRAFGVELDREDRTYIRRKLGMKLGKFGSSIERVSVRVEDVNGRVTSTSRAFDHSSTPWQGDCHGTEVLGLCTGRRFTEVPWQPNPPRVRVTAERQEDGSYTVRAEATSEDGRVVDLGYTWMVTALDARIPVWPRKGSGNGDAAAGLRVEDCEKLEVVISATDDLGNVGYGTGLVHGERCEAPGPGGSV